MGWRERDYSQASWRGDHAAAGGPRRPPAATLTLLIVHGVLFIALMIAREEAGPALDPWLRLGGREEAALVTSPPAPATNTIAPLRVTAIALHPIATQRAWTLAFVLCTIWVLAGPLERAVGAARLIALYFCGNLFAALIYYLVARMNPQVAFLPLDYPVGAFAAWCLASWFVFSDDFVVLLNKVTTRAKVIAVCALVSIALALLTGGLGALAWLAAVFGALPAVYLLGVIDHHLRRRQRRAVATAPAAREAPARVPVRVTAARPDAAADTTPPAAVNIDDILAKISRDGLAALTPAERSRLEAARQAMLSNPEG